MKAQNWSRTISFVLFLLGFLSNFYIVLLGQLYIAEILFIPSLFVFLIGRWRVRLQPELRKIMGLGLLWLLSQIMTDVVRGTPVGDFLRGWAAIAFFLLDIFVLTLLVDGHLVRFLSYVWGYAVGGLVVLFVQPSPYFSIEPWKFGYGPVLALLSFLFVTHITRGNPHKMRPWSGLLIGFGILSLYLNARSLGGIVILSALFLRVRFTAFTWRWFSGIRLRNIISVILFLLVAGWGILQGYVYMGTNGLLPSKLQDKFARQYNGSTIGILLGGRTEMLASVQAVADSPILGHGSWARDMKYRLYLLELPQLGYQRSKAELNYYINSSDLIPAHSHLMQAWVWAGLAGGIFWLWIFLWSFRLLVHSNAQPSGLYLLILFFIIGGIWDIFFSPFGSSMRILWTVRTAGMMLVSRNYES